MWDEREAVLWQEVLRQRDNIAPRLVLADYLMERGDPRGELIVMQCTGGEDPTARAKKLVHAHWEAWLGPVAAVLSPLTSEFRNGMLEVASVGRTGTEDPQYRNLRHHELAMVHTVKPAYVWPAAYAAFMATPDLDPTTLHVDVPSMLAMIANARVGWNIRTLVFEARNFNRRYGGSDDLAPAFAAASRSMPDLEEIRMGAVYAPDLLAALQALPSQFPRLARIDMRDARLTPEFAAQVRSLPLVIL